MNRLVAAAIALVATVSVEAQALELRDPGSGPDPAAQIVVDAIRQSAKADIAFQAAGFFRDGSLGAQPDADALNKLLAYPGEEIYVLDLTGEQVVKALERSLSLLPQSNRGFLQVSGIVARYSAAKPAQSRVVSVTVGKDKLNPSATYRVAVPATLARGALGYFTVWSKDQISGQTGVTVEDAVKAFLTGKSKWPVDDVQRIVGE